MMEWITILNKELVNFTIFEYYSTNFDKVEGDDRRAKSLWKEKNSDGDKDTWDSDLHSNLFYEKNC